MCLFTNFILISFETGNGTISSSASTSSSRNNSPRPLTEAKLRPGVTNRNLSHLQQRNSVNYTGSTLQEDLMKLINPDYNMVSSDDNFNSGGLKPIKQQRNTQNSHSLGNIPALNNGLKVVPVATTDDMFLMRKKSRSREGINLGPHGVPISSELKLKDPLESNGLLVKSNTSSTSGSVDSDIILTTARPATVISSAANGPGTNDIDEKSVENGFHHILHIQEDTNNSTSRKIYSNKAMLTNGNNLNINQNQKKSKDTDLFIPPNSLPLLPDTKEVDWTSVVDNAISQINEGLKKHYFDAEGGPNVPSLKNLDRTMSLDQTDSPSLETGSLSSSSSLSSAGGGSSNRSTNLQSNSSQNSLPELQNQVSQLEDRITKETRRRKSLEQAVRRLTDENRRLQDESQAAVQQLRRFSEWFFQTIDRQT